MPTPLASISPTFLTPHLQHHCFSTFEEFQLFMQRCAHRWGEEVEEAIRLIALHGIRDPLTDVHIPATALELNGSNYRETISSNGCLSRHRAALLILKEMLADQLIPQKDSLALYTPEAITAFAQYLQQHFPHWFGSEYDPPQSCTDDQQHPHQDLCALTLGDCCADVVICIELIEHLYDLPSALSEIARILKPDGYLIATFPFAYNQYNTIIKVRHRPGSTPCVAEEEELLMEPEYHGDPAHPNQGSLVYQIPGWDILDQARSAGLIDPHIHWIAAPSYGVLGRDTPAILVLVAGKS